MVDSPSPALVSQWGACGIAAAAARFVPVPLLDDAIRARAVRIAVDTALEGMDLRLLTAALGDGLSQGRDLTTAAVRYARHFGDKDADPDLDPAGPVGAGAQRVTEALEQPEVVQLLDRFDTEVDAALAR
jgi:hypothetical protein